MQTDKEYVNRQREREGEGEGREREGGEGGRETHRQVIRNR